METDDKNLTNIGVFKKAAYKLYVEYLERSVAHGMRMVRRTEGDSYGRYIWLAFMAFILILTHVDVYHLAVQFMESPTETRLSPKVVHVKNVQFPAIGICSNNQISKAALHRIAKILFEHQELNSPGLAGNNSEEIAEKLLAFTGFLLHPFDSYPEITKDIQSLHDLLVLRFGNGSYPTRNILRLLAPKCDALIVRCVIGAKPVNCSEIFFSRTTTAGVCCLFNYRRKGITTDNRELEELGLPEWAGSNKIIFDKSGIKSSLQVVIQDDPDDYTWKQLTCDGFKAMFLYPEDYPDTNTGNVLIGYNEEYDVSIQPDIIEGSVRMKQFSPKMRHCYFMEEGKEILKQDYYSFGDCMIDCRTRSMIDHCGCMVPVMPGFVEGVSYCLLTDLPCLSLWKGIWWQWQSFDYVSGKKQPPTLLEMCSHCLPSCNVMTYKLSTNSRPLYIPKNKTHFDVGILAGITTSKPTTVTKFFYKTSFSQVKTHDISGNWIVLLGRYGGICSIMYGFSLVVLIEVAYFASGKWFVIWWRCLVQCYKNRLRRKIESQIRHQDLYWDELRPKGSFLIKK